MSTRLIVEAVSNEIVATDSETKLSVTVSVSDADSGASTTGLIKEMFKITDLGLNGPFGNLDYKLTVNERVWDPDDKDKSGVYDLTITSSAFVLPGKPNANVDLQKGKPFAIGIKVFIFNFDKGGGDGGQGQTVVSIVNV